jgi:phospholipase/carboxylesterase/glyoxalase family protein
MFRTRELAAFVRSAVERYGIDPGNVVVVGYSNGANIAASLLLQEPGLLRAAVLFRVMVPFEPDARPDLQGPPVYLASGLRDQLVPANNAARLADILREAGAEVAVRWTDGGHRLSAEDVAGAREWLARIFTP